jgi:hypothetical protein
MRSSSLIRSDGNAMVLSNSFKKKQCCKPTRNSGYSAGPVPLRCWTFDGVICKAWESSKVQLDVTRNRIVSF